MKGPRVPGGRRHRSGGRGRSGADGGDFRCRAPGRARAGPRSGSGACCSSCWPGRGADGHRAVTRILQDGDYRAALLAKLVEEATEAENAPDDELAGELADVWEVVQSLLATLPLSQHEFAALGPRPSGTNGAGSTAGSSSSTPSRLLVPGKRVTTRELPPSRAARCGSAC
jgi:predicted house-cleaning noncanonical NTP pyrophosphatase (MazG superfamily)